MPYKDELKAAFAMSIKNDCDVRTLREVYNNFVDYLNETDCYSGGMFESYGVILDFKAIEEKVVKAFSKEELNVLILCLRQHTYTPLALVLANYVEHRGTK